MRTEYWPDHDTLYLSLADDPRNVESEAVEENIILNFNADDRLVSMEIMNASKHVTPELIDRAEVRRDPVTTDR